MSDVFYGLSLFFEYTANQIGDYYDKLLMRGTVEYFSINFQFVYTKIF